MCKPHPVVRIATSALALFSLVHVVHTVVTLYAESWSRVSLAIEAVSIVLFASGGWLICNEHLRARLLTGARLTLAMYVFAGISNLFPAELLKGRVLPPDELGMVPFSYLLTTGMAGALIDLVSTIVVVWVAFRVAIPHLRRWVVLGVLGVVTIRHACFIVHAGLVLAYGTHAFLMRLWTIVAAGADYLLWPEMGVEAAFFLSAGLASWGLLLPRATSPRSSPPAPEA